MKAVIQKCSQALVSIKGIKHAEIGMGLVVFLGVHENDTEDDAKKIAAKIESLRIFSDENGKMQYDVNDVNGEIMIISQFTLLANTTKGNRPSFIAAAPPEHAKRLYLEVINILNNTINRTIANGIFGADMQISLVNDGPVTIILDTKP